MIYLPVYIYLHIACREEVLDMVCVAFCAGSVITGCAAACAITATLGTVVSIAAAGGTGTVVAAGAQLFS